jgi:CO/xanthine dehydrogenase FAD-binding subunit
MDEYAYDDKNGLVLGAGVNLSSLSQYPIVLEKYPALAKAASMVATHQIRNMATIGGV